MDKQLVIKRTHISYSNDEFEYLNNHSDHPIENHYIFSKVFNNYEDFYNFIINLPFNLEDEFKEEIFTSYNIDFFEFNNLVMMFSDERSGSNKLSIEDIALEDELINISILRKRGLTMDMAYLFMFMDVDKTINKADVLIKDMSQLF